MIYQIFLNGEEGHNIAQPEVLLDEGEVRLVVNVQWYSCVKLRWKLSILRVNEKVLESLRHWLRFGKM